MRVTPKTPSHLALLALCALPASGSAFAQDQASSDPGANPNIVVQGQPLPDASQMTRGPDVKGVITARRGETMQVTAADGSSTVIAITEATRIRTGGLFGGNRNRLGADSLLNGLPVTVKTMQWSGGLVASQVNFKSGDYRTASMIHNGTAQQFAEQSAATAALRGRMGDIDNYNVKGTTNVYFDTGRATLSAAARADLCATASQAESTENALLLVVGYADSTGSDEFNQALSERRAASVINHLQQACRWKPYRVLTPTGMAESDPAASNDTPEGRAQNRRVAVNILVSKAVDGIRDEQMSYAPAASRPAVAASRVP